MTNKKTKKSFIKKFNRQSKPLRIFFLLIGIIYIVGIVLFTKSLLSLKGIETTIRVIVLVAFYIFLIIYFFVGILLLFTGKKKRFIFLMIIASLLSCLFYVGSYFIDKTYGIIDTVQKKYVEYKSVMISMMDTSSYNKIGMISEENDPTGYILPKEMIEKFDIKGEIVKYDDYIEMLTDLYDGKIDAMFVSDGYVTMFNSYEKFAKVASETKVVYEYSKELENKDNVTYSTKDLTEPFTMLLMGIDGTGDGISSASSFNGDSLMLITFNPNTLTATMFSIPRDTYVPISCRGDQENKINSSAYGGTTCVVNTIQNLIGIDIDYYVKINFTGVVKLVDDLGGIYVDVPMDFCEQDSQRRFGEYEICLNTGYQKLNGEEALALSRHRHSLPLGDFQRVQNQQLVVEAMIESAKNISSIEDFYQILNDVANNVDTNMSTSQILSLYKVGKNILLNKINGNSSITIEKTYLTGYDLTMYMNSTKSYVYTFQYYKQSLEDIVHAMKVNLELEEPELIKTFSFSANEPYETAVIGKDYYNEKRRELLPNFVGQNRSYVEAWALERGITVNYKEVSEGDSLFNSSYSNGYVVSQEEHAGLLVDNLSSINISIIKNDNASSSNNDENETDNNNDENTEIEKEEKLPDFTGKSLDKFNSWKNSLKGKNMIIDVEILDANDLLTMEIEDLKDNTIYKQSVKSGTNLEDIEHLIVYYYKAS